MFSKVLPKVQSSVSQLIESKHLLVIPDDHEVNQALLFFALYFDVALASTKASLKIIGELGAKKLSYK